MDTIQTTQGVKSTSQILDDLTYINYAFNRDRSPEIAPARWARIYPSAAQLEARYQADLAATNKVKSA